VDRAVSDHAEREQEQKPGAKSHDRVTAGSLRLPFEYGVGLGASACNGNRDVVRLKEIALRGVSGRLLHRLGMLAPHLLPATLLAA
jgi:hypothetical protein